MRCIVMPKSYDGVTYFGPFSVYTCLLIYIALILYNYYNSWAYLHLYSKISYLRTV